MTVWSELPSTPRQKPEARWPSFAVPLLVACALAGFGQLFAAALVASLGCLLAVATMIHKGFRVFILQLTKRVSVFVGVVLRYLLLTPFYLLIMTPLAGYQRAFGKGRISLDINKKRKTYWEEAQPSKDYEHPY